VDHQDGRAILLVPGEKALQADLLAFADEGGGRGPDLKGLGRGWGGIWLFFLAAGGALVAAAYATPRLRLTNAGVLGGLAALAAWALFAALAPTALGIDHQGLLSIVRAGDKTALHKGFGDYPLRALAPIGAGFGALLLIAMRLTRAAPPAPGAPSAEGG
jgi:hypothetical protein